MKAILGIESSCDETAAALLDEHGRVLASTIRSQVDLHRRFGGVVPEIAGRSHVEHILPVIEDTLEKAGCSKSDVSAVAVTYAPGLVGSLIIGVSAAKALAFALDVPLIPVDHVQAHVYSCYQNVQDPQLPSACLVVSGGHTSLFEVESLTQTKKRGETVDDAAGEAFDKVAAILGLPYPGGPSIERAAHSGAPCIAFPRTLISRESLDFSFSGIKTAVLYHCRGQNAKDRRTLSETEIANVAASFQEAVVEVLVTKLLRLADQRGLRSFAIGGGVAANQRLRARAAEALRGRDVPLYLAPMHLTTDNAIMIAGLGRLYWQQGKVAGLDLDVSPFSTDESWWRA